MTVKDEKCLVYCECKQCEMGNLAYLWNAVLCRHETEHSSPGTSHCGEMERRYWQQLGRRPELPYQMDRNTDTSVDVTWIFTEKAPNRAFSFY